MTVVPPQLSVVIPAYNEEGRLRGTLDAWLSYFAGRDLSWEILVVDDGSHDRTPEVVRQVCAAEPRVRLLSRPHQGKGAAVRSGMLSVFGNWRFMADADLSMRPAEIERFFDQGGKPRYDVTIGSRETSGARRIAEPQYRHVIGRFYNLLVRLLVVGGVDDTQCGYKLFTADAAASLFSRQTLDGFGFDVELLFLADREGLTIGEVPLTWHYDPDSRVSLAKGLDGFLDIVRVRMYAWLGRYDARQPRSVESHR